MTLSEQYRERAERGVECDLGDGLILRVRRLGMMEARRMNEQLKQSDMLGEEEAIEVMARLSGGLIISDEPLEIDLGIGDFFRLIRCASGMAEVEQMSQSFRPR